MGIGRSDKGDSRATNNINGTMATGSEDDDEMEYSPEEAGNTFLLSSG